MSNVKKAALEYAAERVPESAKFKEQIIVGNHLREEIHDAFIRGFEFANECSSVWKEMLPEGRNSFIQAINLKAKKNTIWQELSNALLCIASHRFICHSSDSDWGGSVLVMEKNGKAFARTYWFKDDTGTIYFDWLSVDESERGNGIATELLNVHIEVAKLFKIETMLFVKKDTWIHEWYSRKGYKYYKDYEKESNAIWMRMLP